MKFFNVDGTIRRENGESEVFGWVWKDLNDDRYMKMTIYNTDGSVRSTEYYDNHDFDIITHEEIENLVSDENSKENVNTIKWYQRTTSTIEENNKSRLFDLLINLNNRESNLLLPIVDGARFLSLTKTPGPTTEAIINHSYTIDISDGSSRLLRLKRLYEIFDISSRMETFKKPYEFFDEADSVHDVNKCIDYYLEELDGVKEILLFSDGFPPRYRRTEVDTGPNGIEIDQYRELFTDIDQTLLKLFDKTCELHCEVEKIRKCFLVYEKRIQSLLEKSKTTRKDLFETQYLDNLILMLDYKVEDVKHNWPFRLGHFNSNVTDINLVI